MQAVLSFICCFNRNYTFHNLESYTNQYTTEKYSSVYETRQIRLQAMMKTDTIKFQNLRDRNTIS